MKNAKLVSAVYLLISLTSTLAFDLNTSAVRDDDEQLVFAFELVRHGARAPIEDRDIDKFTVAEGMLTPEGMRQRYLLGRHSRQRYTETYSLIPLEYDPKQVYIQSTNVNRTMQSGYSELLGLYPPGQGEQLTKPMADAVRGVSAPPFGVRDAERINSDLGADALPNRPISIPISVFNNDDIHDDVSYDGCPYISTVEDSRIDDDAVFADYEWMIDSTRQPIQAMYDLDDEYIDSLNYHHYERLTDTAVALDFEGYPEHETYFSDDQWELTHEFQKVYLTERDTKDASNLEVSRILRKPIGVMDDKVRTLLSNSDLDRVSSLKYVIYSAHDDQVTNMLNFLGLDYYWIPYASTVTFELKYSARCLADSGKASEECFGVSILSNGRPLMFDGDCTGDLFRLEGCSYPEFKALMAKKWYSGPSADDLDAACFTTPQ